MNVAGTDIRSKPVRVVVVGVGGGGQRVRSHPPSWANYLKIMQFFTRNRVNLKSEFSFDLIAPPLYIYIHKKKKKKKKKKKNSRFSPPFQKSVYGPTTA